MNAMLSPASVSASVHGPFLSGGLRAEPPSLVSTLAGTWGGMLRWFAHGSASAVLPMQRTSLRQTQHARRLNAANLVATSARPERPERQAGRQARPQALRVLRLQEAGQARSSVGRMVISGRMADVCAELDRLVAREAALH